jgi:hypothetical protein
MDIVIDVTRLQEASANPFLLMWVVFQSGGWIFAAVFGTAGMLIGAVNAIVTGKQYRFLTKTPYVILALDIPKGNEQTPKAVESIFAHIHGIQRSGNLKEKYLKGYLQLPISLEIIGIEGQTQFCIRCPVDSRDLVEAAIYAQYPDAAITEAREYTDDIPLDFEEANLDLWGTELVLYNKDIYPIRTYPFFEHSMTQQFLDPLASLLEMMGRMVQTEQIWIQLVLIPVDDSWKSRSIDEVKSLMGAKPKAKPLIPSGITDIPEKVATGLYDSMVASLLPTSAWSDATKKEEKKDKIKFGDLTSGEKGTIEAIQMKASKLGWLTKFRVLYIAQKDILSKGKGVAGILGAIKQYNTQDLNGFKPDSKTKTGIDYFFIQRRLRIRKRKILRNYKMRNFYRKFARKTPKPFILNTEELASIFHFPVMTVKAPQVQKTEARRGEPPMRLPAEPIFPRAEPSEKARSSHQPPAGAPPPNLPI